MNATSVYELCVFTKEGNRVNKPYRYTIHCSLCSLTGFRLRGRFMDFAIFTVKTELRQFGFPINHIIFDFNSSHAFMNIEGAMGASAKEFNYLIIFTHIHAQTKQREGKLCI